MSKPRIAAAPAAAPPAATDPAAQPAAPTDTTGTPFVMLAAVEAAPTEDGRMLGELGGTWRELPLTLMAMLETSDWGHDGAQVAGRIDRTWRGDETGNETADGLFLWAEGVFDDAGVVGNEVARLVSGGFISGVSIDAAPTVIEYWLVNPDGSYDQNPDPAALESAFWGEDPEGRTILVVFSEYTIMAATVTATPAVGQARIEVPQTVTASLHTEEPVVIGLTDDPSTFVVAGPRRIPMPRLVGHIAARAPVTASAAGLAPVHPPAGWFDPPTDDELEEMGAGQVNVADDGRVFGYAALWGQCHIGYAEGCTDPPRDTDFALFHRGSMTLADARRINVGPITMGTGHAALHLGAQAAAEHYDNSGSVIADVRMGKDDRGIWFAGAVDPDASPARVRRFKALSVSGDWRWLDGRYQLVGLLSVPVPGFPQARVEHGEPVSLVAAGLDQRLPTVVASRAVARIVGEQLADKLGIS